MSLFSDAMIICLNITMPIAFNLLKIVLSVKGNKTYLVFSFEKGSIEEHYVFSSLI